MENEKMVDVLRVIKGSVKNVNVLKEATEKEAGLAFFDYTDSYSVFDYGRMPDLIPNKGECISRMAAFNFKELGKKGFKSHFIKMDENKMYVRLYRVLNPEKYDLNKINKNYLIPLEIIFRNSLPQGSSVFRRLAKGQTTWQKLGLKKIPKPWEKLKPALLDVSTKLEAKDRYINWAEAQKIAAVTDSQLEEIKRIANEVNAFINQKAAEVGVEHADGKIELAFDENGEIRIIDVLGTPDENRFLYKKTQLNKQMIRDYYIELGDWFQKIEMQGIREVPPSLPKEFIEIVSNAYKSICEAWIGKKIWNAPSVEEVYEAHTAFIEKVKENKQ